MGSSALPYPPLRRFQSAGFTPAHWTRTSTSPGPAPRRRPARDPAPPPTPGPQDLPSHERRRPSLRLLSALADPHRGYSPRSSTIDGLRASMASLTPSMRYPLTTFHSSYPVPRPH